MERKLNSLSASRFKNWTNWSLSFDLFVDTDWSLGEFHWCASTGSSSLGIVWLPIIVWIGNQLAYLNKPIWLKRACPKGLIIASGSFQSLRRPLVYQSDCSVRRSERKKHLRISKCSLIILNDPHWCDSRWCKPVIWSWKRFAFWELLNASQGEILLRNDRESREEWSKR